MALQWADPMGRLSVIDERLADRAEQTARDQTGWRERDMAPDDGELPASGNGKGGKDRLRDSITCRWSGGGDRGRNSRNVRPLGETLTRGRVGVSPH